MGGEGNGGTPLNDVWTSVDGVNWTIVPLSGAIWSTRSAHTSLVYNNTMWVMGGWNGSSLNDVWYSTTGGSWTLATGNAWSQERAWFTSLVYDNRMWIMGGYNGGVSLNDVWYSTDGGNWTQATNNAAWPLMYEHTSLVYDNKMWIIGGGWPPFNDVWYSPGYQRLVEVKLSASFQLPGGRLIGEDVNFNGLVDPGEDTNVNGELDSPVQLRFLLSEKKEAALMGGP